MLRQQLVASGGDRIGERRLAANSHVHMSAQHFAGGAQQITGIVDRQEMDEMNPLRRAIKNPRADGDSLPGFHIRLISKIRLQRKAAALRSFHLIL